MLPAFSQESRAHSTAQLAPQLQPICPLGPPTPQTWVKPPSGLLRPGTPCCELVFSLEPLDSGFWQAAMVKPGEVFLQDLGWATAEPALPPGQAGRVQCSQPSLQLPCGCSGQGFQMDQMGLGMTMGDIGEDTLSSI